MQATETITDERRWAALYPDLGTGPVSVEPCISESFFALERERIFRRAWLNVGRESDVPHPGDHFVKDLPVASTSVLVVRGTDGVIRAFHNVCSHRCNKLVMEASGSCRSFVCRFHGWVYGTDGSLLTVTDEQMFFDIDKAANGLTPVACEIAHGFIFVKLDPGRGESLRDYLGESYRKLVGYPFDAMPTRFSWHAEVRCNWKLLVDSVQDIYHGIFLHQRSTYRQDELSGLAGQRSPQRPFAVELYDPHRWFSFPRTSQRHHLYGAAGRPVALPPGVNPTRNENWAWDGHMIFPNLAILVGSTFWITMTAWPLEVDRSLFEMSMYYPEAENAGQRFYQEFGKCTLRDITLEDLSVCEATQSVLASGARTHFNLQDQEIVIRHGHKVVRDWVGA
jgi:phenylpropionate dioxygenase-like ring-hydroxylating dioxygenase large terminal subunit